MNQHPFIALAGALCLGFILRHFVRNKWRNPRHLSRPPGPRGLPLLGNLVALTRPRPWEVYDKLCKRHGAFRIRVRMFFLTNFSFSGDMVWLEALGQGILVVGSLDRALDLFDRKSMNYSDRPSMPTLEP